jgi:hypothetical protein
MPPSGLSLEADNFRPTRAPAGRPRLLLQDLFDARDGHPEHLLGEDLLYPGDRLVDRLLGRDALGGNAVDRRIPLPQTFSCQTRLRQNGASFSAACGYPL